jgi:hypothetical protein
MNDSPLQDDAQAQRLPLHARIRYTGMAILLVGLVSAALLYVFAPDDRGSNAAAAIESGRVYEYNIERVGGMAAVYAARFNRWLAGLWHGRPLAYTVAILSVAIALLCFMVARMIFVRLPSAQDKDASG